MSPMATARLVYLGIRSRVTRRGTVGQRPQDRPRQKTRHGHGDECALEKPTHVDVLTAETCRGPSLARGISFQHITSPGQSNPVPGTGFVASL